SRRRARVDGADRGGGRLAGRTAGVPARSPTAEGRDGRGRLRGAADPHRLPAHVAALAALAATDPTTLRDDPEAGWPRHRRSAGPRRQPELRRDAAGRTAVAPPHATRGPPRAPPRDPAHARAPRPLRPHRPPDHPRPPP